MDYIRRSALSTVDHDWLGNILSSSSAATLYLYVLLFGYCVSFVVKGALRSKYVLRAPYAGYRSIFEPAFLVRLRFSNGARPQINEGYRKVGDLLDKRA